MRVIQVKQATGYFADHLTEEGDYDLWAYNHLPGLFEDKFAQDIRAIPNNYNVWIEFDCNDLDDPVKDYYCQCPAVLRTIGANTASFLYYLCHIAHRASKVALLTQTRQFRQALVSSKKHFFL